MKKLNTTLFELDVIFTTMSHAQTLEMCIRLKEVRKQLLEVRNECLEDTFEFGQNVDEVSFIDAQLIYINKNIRTFENALLCHYQLFSQKIKILNDEIIIYLN
jgi:hypothetical protein